MTARIWSSMAAWSCAQLSRRDRGPAARLCLGDRPGDMRVSPRRAEQQSARPDELLVEALKRARAKVIGAAPNYDPDPCRARSTACSSWRASPMSISTCISTLGQFARRDGHPPGGCELDREMQAWAAASRSATHVQAFPHHAAGRSALTGAADRRCRRGGDRCCRDRAVHDGARPGIQRRGAWPAPEPAGRARGELLAAPTNNVLNPFTPFGDGSCCAWLQPAGQCLPELAGKAGCGCFAMLTERSAHADEPAGLRTEGRQPGGYRGAGRDDAAGAGRRGDRSGLPAWRSSGAGAADGDAAARRGCIVPPAPRGGKEETRQRCRASFASLMKSNRIFGGRFHRSLAPGRRRCCCARGDGLVVALVRRRARLAATIAWSAMTDLRGHGRIEVPPPEPALTMDRLVQDCPRAAGSPASAAPVHIVGNSAGGYVAQNLAMASPELVHSLMLFGSRRG